MLIALAGCAAARQPEPAGGRVDRFIHEGWLLGRTSAEVRDRLGPPVTTEVTTVMNRHVPRQIDEIRTLAYEGLLLTFYEVSQPARELLMAVSVSSAKYPGGWGLQIGTQQDDVRNVLGPPSQESAALWIYKHSADNSQVAFTLAAGRVSRIDWSFYVD